MSFEDRVLLYLRYVSKKFLCFKNFLSEGRAKHLFFLVFFSLPSHGVTVKETSGTARTKVTVDGNTVSERRTTVRSEKPSQRYLPFISKQMFLPFYSFK